MDGEQRMGNIVSVTIFLIDQWQIPDRVIFRKLKNKLRFESEHNWTRQCCMTYLNLITNMWRELGGLALKTSDFKGRKTPSLIPTGGKLSEPVDSPHDS
jgi:hypothetical protein